MQSSKHQSTLLLELNFVTLKIVHVHLQIKLSRWSGCGCKQTGIFSMGQLRLVRKFIMRLQSPDRDELSQKCANQAFSFLAQLRSSNLLVLTFLSCKSFPCMIRRRYADSAKLYILHQVRVNFNVVQKFFCFKMLGFV